MSMMAPHWKLFLIRSLTFLIVFYYAGAMHTPAYMLWAIVLVNFAIGICYMLIPDQLKQDSFNGRVAVVIDAENLVPRFRSFIAWCGEHHFVHWAFMMMMAAGFMKYHMTGNTVGLAEGIVGFVVVFGVDLTMLYHSVLTLIDFKKEKDL